MPQKKMGESPRMEGSRCVDRTVEGKGKQRLRAKANKGVPCGPGSGPAMRYCGAGPSPYPYQGDGLGLQELSLGILVVWASCVSGGSVAHLSSLFYIFLCFHLCVFIWPSSHFFFFWILMRVIDHRKR